MKLYICSQEAWAYEIGCIYILPIIMDVQLKLIFNTKINAPSFSPHFSSFEKISYDPSYNVGRFS